MEDQNLPRSIVGNVLLLSLSPLQRDVAVEYDTATELPMLLLINKRIGLYSRVEI